jgi:hypothetical protein
MRHPFVGGASLQYLKACLPQGMGGEEPDDRVVVYDKYTRTMIVLSTHAGRHFGQEQVTSRDAIITPPFSAL